MVSGVNHEQELRRWSAAMKDILKGAGRTQKWVEEQIGWARGYLSQLLGSKPPDLKVAQLLRVLEAVAVSPAELLSRIYREGSEAGPLPSSGSGHRQPATRRAEEPVAALAEGLAAEVKGMASELARLREEIALLHRALPSWAKDRDVSDRAWEEDTSEDPETTAGLVVELLCARPERRQELLSKGSRHCTLRVAQALLQAARRSAVEDGRATRELAELGLRVAELLDSAVDGERRVKSLRAYGWAVFGNSQRIVGDLRGAEQSFTKARNELCRLEEHRSVIAASVDSLEASLRRELHEFAAALKLAQRAIETYHALGMRESEAKALLKRSTICDFMGDLAGNVAALERAANLIERDEDPWLALILRHNLIFGLARDRQFQRARTLLGETEDLYRQVTVPAMWARRHWVEGLIREGEEDLAGAIGQLEAARDQFAEHSFFFDAALVSIDLAAVLLAEGRTPEVKAVAAAAYALLEGQGVHPDALAALSQFQQAAAMERLDREVLREIALRLSRAAEFRPLPA
jgi:tetratricopeptide (TPR) repeat protein